MPSDLSPVQGIIEEPCHSRWGPTPVSLASPESLIEMQNFGPYSSPTEPESACSAFWPEDPLVRVYAHYSLRSIDVELYIQEHIY